MRRRAILGIDKQEFPWLCFTGVEAGSSLFLTYYGSPTVVSLETSLDGKRWTPYSFGTSISLGVGDKVYFRNASDEVTGFSVDPSNYYNFKLSGKIKASGNLISLVDKTGLSDTVPTQGCFRSLFATSGNKTLIESPVLPKYTRGYCFYELFSNQSDLTKVTVRFEDWYANEGGVRSEISGYWGLSAPTGTFICPSTLPEERSSSRIPTGWTRVNL